MAFAPGPFVSDVLAEYSTFAERWLDRCKNAIDTSRNGNYTFEQFARDVTNTWVDGTIANIKPLQVLGVLTVQVQPPFPIVRFPLLSKNDTSRIVVVPTVPAGIAPENLGDGTGINQIPSGNVTVTKLTNTAILVELKNLGPLTIPAGLYSGRIMAGGKPVARIEVDFP